MSRFDIVLGHYVFCNLHHGGQNSDLYKRLSRITRYFSPGAGFSEEEFLDSNNDEDMVARDVYYALCAKHGFSADGTS